VHKPPSGGFFICADEDASSLVIDGSANKMSQALPGCALSCAFTPPNRQITEAEP